jgi:hypothetical protein
MKNYICNDRKYACDKGYVYLPIEIINSLPKTILIEGDQLHLKSSFHVSLICLKELSAKYNRENLEQEILEKFCDFVSTQEISFVGFTGEFLLAASEERKTVVARCNVSNLESCTKKISRELKIDIPVQPTHVTLYTLQPDAGIGLNSFETLEQKARPIDVPVEIKSNLGN